MSIYWWLLDNSFNDRSLRRSRCFTYRQECGQYSLICGSPLLMLALALPALEKSHWMSITSDDYLKCLHHPKEVRSTVSKRSFSLMTQFCRGPPFLGRAYIWSNEEHAWDWDSFGATHDMAGSVRPSHSLDRTLPATRWSLNCKAVQQIMDESSASSFFFGFTDLPVLVLQRSFRQLQSFCEVQVIGGWAIVHRISNYPRKTFVRE